MCPGCSRWPSAETNGWRSARSLTSEFGIEHNGLILRWKGLTSPEEKSMSCVQMSILYFPLSWLFIIVSAFYYTPSICLLSNPAEGYWLVVCTKLFGEASGKKVMRQRQNRSNQTINFSEFQGEYKRVPTPQLPPRFDQRPVWEWGCPARGLIHA